MQQSSFNLLGKYWELFYYLLCHWYYCHHGQMLTSICRSFHQCCKISWHLRRPPFMQNVPFFYRWYKPRFWPVLVVVSIVVHVCVYWVVGTDRRHPYLGIVFSVALTKPTQPVFFPVKHAHEASAGSPITEGTIIRISVYYLPKFNM